MKAAHKIRQQQLETAKHRSQQYYESQMYIPLT